MDFNGRVLLIQEEKEDIGGGTTGGPGYGNSAYGMSGSIAGGTQSAGGPNGSLGNGGVGSNGWRRWPEVVIMEEVLQTDMVALEDLVTLEV